MLTAAHGASVGSVFVIILENRNFTAGTDTSGGAVILGNSAAPYLNALITPGTSNAAQTAWCSAYHNVFATPSGSNPSIHPSEPNYIWAECGSNLSVLNDNDPYGSGKSVAAIASFLAANPTFSGENLCALLQNSGVPWKSYNEGTDLQNTTGGNGNISGNITNTVLPQAQWTVPLASFSGNNASYTNPYNGSHQWNFACKHTGQLFFPATNGSTITTANTTPANVASPHYAPLEQLQVDLTNNTVAEYNTITPDQFNDMHTALTGGFTYAATAANHNFGTGVHYTGDLAQIAQGDNLCAILVPQIMASQAYQNNGAIIIWTDETEGTNANDFKHTLTEIIISPLAKGNAYQSTLNYTHSSDVATLQEIYGVTANTNTGFLNDAAVPSNSSGALAGTAPGFGTETATDLSDLFVPGTIPAGLPGLTLDASGYAFNRRTNSEGQTVTVTNVLTQAITTPIYLVVGNLSANTTLLNSAGTTVNNLPGSPYVSVSPTGLAAGASITVPLSFSAPSSGFISDILGAVTTSGQP